MTGCGAGGRTRGRGFPTVGGGALAPSGLPSWPDRGDPGPALSVRTPATRIHESNLRPAHQVRVVNGIPTVSVERTVLDLCGSEHPKRAERALDNALAMDLTTVQKLGLMMAETGRRGRPGTALVIEADSRRHHPSWLDVEADHRRDLLLAAAGWTIVRVNWHQLLQEPELFIAAVRAHLRRAAA